MIPREGFLDTARRVYRSYGFAPIDTPALEYAEVLLGKIDAGAEVQKQIYRFKDHGDRDVALRFDLTVPFARFAALHLNEIKLPFKRYHLGPVWRGETPGAGRFREFWQCDFDTIGTTSNAADIEVALVIHDLMRALGLEHFEIKVNNRLVLNGLLEELGLAKLATPLLRALDKLGKASPEAVAKEMVDRSGVTADQATRVLALASMTGSNAEILDRLQREFGGNARAADGIARLRELLDVARAAGVPDGVLHIDLSIARGLDYYTGTVYETFLTNLPKELAVGSVCSGGRYDNLAGLYTKRELPGVGASLGLDRLLAVMEKLNMLPKTSTTAPVLIVQFNPERLGDYQKMARSLRAEGIGTEVYPEAKKIGKQLEYAESRGFRAALIAGTEEFAQGVWKIKDMMRREEATVAATDVLPRLRSLLGGE
ncbi:MAG: histidine--tRNA ligase [Gemmataceae bacterium]|nr:histidine--tRNA ligase [Gemmataceae bacterium]